MRDPVRIHRFGRRGELAVICWDLAPSLADVSLTRAEREVALAAGMGASNREIARVRRTSERTVANQLAAIYRKLSIASRAELAAVLATPSHRAARPGSSR
jgi:DNA-binding CsgD family transcriptional regulator